MLVAFVLLLVLLFWRHQVQDEVELAGQLSPNERELLKDGAVVVPAEQLENLKEQAGRASGVLEQHLQALRDGAITVLPEQLEDLKRQAEQASGISKRHLQALRDGAITILPEQLEDLKRQAERASDVSEQQLQALNDGAVLVPSDQLEDLKEQAGLMEAPTLYALASAAAVLEPDELQKLTQLAQNPAPLSSNIVEALKLRQALDPDWEDSNEELVVRIEDLLAKEGEIDNRLAEDAAAQREFIDNLKRELAADVEKAGGNIDPFGRVIFPETVVFRTGSAVIPPSFKTVLDDICPRWLVELRNSANRFDIDEIRIEGHSSPEWASAKTKRDAWIANLALSQRRAQSVLSHCLDHAAGTPLGKWARSKLTAIGYSSSRPVTVNGEEAPSASRRVVLGYEFSREGLISDLEDAGRMNAGPGVIRSISGKALVIDADTIKVGEAEVQVRLDGIDAPELKQLCIAADGSQWSCGQKARLALDQRIADRNVICDRLRLGLRRLRGVCRVEGETAELNRWVVKEGWAFALVKSSRAYAADEAVAREARRGIWSGGDPVPPWEWRQRHSSRMRPQTPSRQQLSIMKKQSLDDNLDTNAAPGRVNDGNPGIPRSVWHPLPITSVNGIPRRPAVGQPSEWRSPALQFNN